MATTASSLRQQFSRAPRYQRLLSYTLVAYLIYAMLLGLLVPYLVKTIAPKKASALVNRPVLIQDVSINPFTLKFEIQGFQIQTQEQQNFVGLGRVTLQINLWKSLFNRSFNLEMVEVDQAVVKIEKLDEIRYNFSDIEEYMEAQAKRFVALEAIAEETDKGSDLPYMQIANISITNSAFEFKDKPTGTVLNYPAINLGVTQFNTLTMLDSKQQVNMPVYNSYQVSINSADDSAVTSAGRFQVSPLQAQGKLALKHIKLTTLWPFIAKQFIAKLESGVIDFTTDYQFISTNEAPQITTTAGQLSLRTLVFTDPDKEVVNLPLLTVAGIKLDLLQQQVDLDNISTDGLQVTAHINKAGTLDLVNVFTPALTNKPDQVKTEQSQVVAAENADSQEWLMTLGEFNLSNYAINITETLLTDATVWRLFPININTKALTSRLDAPINYDLTIGINDKGKLSSQGLADVQQQSVDASISLEKLNLAQFQPYLASYVNITIEDGELSTQGQLYADAQGAARFDGALKLNALAISDNNSDDMLVKWQDFNINSINFDQTKNSLLIDQITILQPYAQVIVAADKSSNISDLVVDTKTITDKSAAIDGQSQVQRTEVQQSQTKQPGDTKNALLIEINQITLAQGEVDYSDASLQPTFEATIENIEGNVGKISSTATKNAQIDIKGIVNKYAHITLNGVANPLTSDPYFDVEFVFDNFELPTVSPYSGMYAGLDIDEGQLSLALKYKLEKGHLSGSNQIFIDQLDINDSKDTDVTTMLPIMLAIPLLKDSSGAIDLGVHVSGDVDNPSFNIGSMVLESFTNIIIKAVTSPFTLLASLADTSEELDKINFSDGVATLNKNEQNKLDELANALEQRPQLKLNVKGSYDDKMDKKALQYQAVNTKLSNIAGNQIKPGTNPTNLTLSSDFKTALVSLYEQESKDKADLLRDAIAKQKTTLTSAELEQVWLRSLYIELSKLQVISDKQLRGLARSRANAVKLHLREANKVGAGRIFVLSHQKNVNSTTPQTTLTLSSK